MGSKQSDNVTQRTVTELPAEVKPFATRILNEAQNQFDSGPRQFFQGPLFAGPSDATNQAFTGIQNFALNNPTTANARNLLNQTIQGDFLQPSQASLNAFDSAADRVTKHFSEAIRPNLDAQFSLAGRSQNSGAFQNELSNRRTDLGRALGELADKTILTDFRNERDNQQSALGLVPTINREELTGLNALRQVGSQQEGLAQRGIDEAKLRHDFDQNKDFESLQKFASFIFGNNFGSNSTTSKPVHTNRGAQALGGLLSLGGLLGGGGLFGGLF